MSMGNFLESLSQVILAGRFLVGRLGVVAPMSQLVKGRLSDAGGLGFESQAGRVLGRPIPSLWGDRHPAIKGLQPPEHHAGQFHPDHEKYPPSQSNQ